MFGSSLSSSKGFTKGSLSHKNTNASQPQPELELDAKDRALFGLSSYDEIDSYFQGLCQETSYKSPKIETIVSQVKFKQPPVGPPLSATRIKPQFTELFSPGLSYNELASPTSLHLENREKSQIDPVVETTIQRTNTNDSTPSYERSTTKKRTLNFTGQWTENDEQSKAFYRNFGISQAALIALETEEQKENYVIEGMKRKLDDDLYRWKKDVDRQEKDVQKFERLNEERKVKLQNEKADIFKWLKLKTKFGFLEKRLKSNLMELLNDYDNQRDLEKSLDDVRSRDKSIIGNVRRINLDHIPAVNNSEILADVLGNNEPIFKVTKTYRKKRNQGQDSSRPETTRSTNASFKTSTTPRGFNNGRSMFGTKGGATSRDFNTTNTESHNRLNTLSPTHYTKTEGNEDDYHGGENHYMWDLDAEKIFKNHKEESKARMFNEIKSSSWNEVALSPFIQASHIEEKQKSQRNTRLEKYRAGETLSPQEYANIANTSMLLNGYSDKRFIQSVVNNLEPEVLEAVEIDLAQQILHDYQKGRSQMQKARMEYLNKINITNKKIVKHNDEEHLRRERVKIGKIEQEQMRKETLQKFEAYERHKYWNKKPGQSFDESKSSINFNMEKADDGVPKRLFSLKKKDFLLDAKASKRLRHPNSKLIINAVDRQKDFLGLSAHVVDPKLLKRNNENAEEFKLSIHSSLNLKRKDNFTRYYSGGPPEYDYDNTAAYYSTDIPRFKGTPLEHKASTLLKAQIKGLIERQKFRTQRQHILNDRKVIRALGDNDEEGLPDFVKTTFLALTEERTESPLKSRQPRPRPDYKAAVVELHSKDPLLYRKFQREVQKQYAHYQLTNHKDREGREDMSPKTRTDEKFKQTKSLVSALRTSMNMLPEVALHTDADRGKSRKELTVQTGQEPRRGDFSTHSPRDFKVNTLASIDEDLETKKRPQTAKNNERTTFAIPSRTHSKLLLVPTKSNMSTTSINIKKQTKTLPAERPKTAKAEKKVKLDFQADVENEIKDRLSKIALRGPPKGLLLKQRKLLTAAKTGNLYVVKTNGYAYFEPDVNAKDDKGNTALYYSAQKGFQEFSQFLVDLGARVNEACDKGDTPLHMAFKSDNEGVIMLLLIKGGNLNTINEDGLTPLAYGSQRVLTLLDLNAGVATFTGNSKSARQLPPEYDNNYLLNRGNWKKPKDEDTATFKYKPLESPRNSIRKDDRYLSQYIQPGNTVEKLNKDMVYPEDFTEQPQTTAPEESLSN